MEARSVENVVNYYSHDFFTILIWYSAQSLAYAFFVYFNFSGYMDIVIGIGRLLGFKLPENFDRPFAAENYLDFWQRWHMTLSEWFKTYVFNPLVKKLYDSTGQQPKRMPLLGVIGYFVTFFLLEFGTCQQWALELRWAWEYLSTNCMKLTCVQNLERQNTSYLDLISFTDMQVGDLPFRIFVSL